MCVPRKVVQMQLIVMKNIDGPLRWNSPSSRAISRELYTALVAQMQLWHIQWLVFRMARGLICIHKRRSCQLTLSVSRTRRCNRRDTSTVRTHSNAPCVYSMTIQRPDCVCAAPWLHQTRRFIVVTNSTSGKCVKPFYCSMYSKH